MLDNQFSLKSESSKISIKGGFLNQIPDSSSKISLGDEKASIDFIMEENTSLEAFEIKLLTAIKKRSYYSHLHLIFKNKIGSVLTLIVSLVIITLIALLSIHGSLTYDLFSGSNSSNIFDFNGIYLYLMLSLIILLLLIVSPRIILGQYSNLFEWANSRFSTNSRIIRRLTRELNRMNKVSGEDRKINVWNPLIAGTDSWICTQLIPALAQQSSQVNIFIKTDEKDSVMETMKNNGSKDLYTSQAINDDSEANMSFPYKLLSSWEKECMHCLLFSSSINLPDGWKESGSELKIKISIELAEQVYHLYGPKLSSMGSSQTTFEKFINRCIYDYKYMNPDTDKRVHNLSLLDTSLPKEIDHSLKEAIGDTVKNNIVSISANITDPLALIILMGLLASDHAQDTRKIDLLTAFIKNVKRIESYQLMSKYWKHISLEKNKAAGNFKLGLLQLMDAQTLGELSTCFVNSGMYTNALEVFDILENIYPTKIAIEIADLKDSLGEYREALQIVLKADKDWVKSGIEEDRALIQELYQLTSWVIVSGRFDDHKEEGHQYLDKAEAMLRKLSKNENYILFLTRLFNTKANYNEWEQNYELAIENYEKALKLPSTVLRKSSLLSNRGIIERLLGNKAHDISVKRKHFLESRSNIGQALDMKRSIGENNQIPGTSHNLAETLLELARITKEKGEQIKVLKEAGQVTSQGLAILLELNSQKRKGRLLAEKFIAHHMLGELGEKSEESRIRKTLDDWMQNEDKDSYDYKEVIRLLDQFGIE
jgi:tetratricopeptide (TPR) repeat protein